jgi:hypothetical protein
MLAEGERRAVVWRGEEGGGVERREGRRAQLGREGRGLGFWGWEADYIWRRVGGCKWARGGAWWVKIFVEGALTWLSAKRQF